MVHCNYNIITYTAVFVVLNKRMPWRLVLDDHGVLSGFDEHERVEGLVVRRHSRVLHSLSCALVLGSLFVCQRILVPPVSSRQANVMYARVFWSNKSLYCRLSNDTQS